jgi:ribosomal protein S18 acetylase RimI-like enzyme
VNTNLESNTNLNTNKHPKQTATTDTVAAATAAATLTTAAAPTFTTREILTGKGQICNDLLRRLPLWFGIESAIQDYVADVEAMPTFAAFASDSEQAIGFVALNPHNEFTAEVHVMAVHPDFHRQGVGRLLLTAVEDNLRQKKFEFLSVKTLSPSRPNREYDLTRKFYLSLGFRPVEEFKTLWGEANPCWLMIKSLK